MDFSTVFGLALGAVAILLGQMLEGGHLGQIVQITAGLIVFGGTAGATFAAFPMEDIRYAVSQIPFIFKKIPIDLEQTKEEIMTVSTLARKEGLLAIDAHRSKLSDSLLKRSLRHVIDGVDPAVVREIIDLEIDTELEKRENAARVFEGAGGYAPTIGIIGAVLGLIHVMYQLEDPSKIGPGIAVAFVATLYGVGLANLILLPWGAKLKRKSHQALVSKELVKLGVLGIQEGLNPHFLKEKLDVIVRAHHEKA